MTMRTVLDVTGKVISVDGMADNSVVITLDVRDEDGQCQKLRTTEAGAKGVGYGCMVHMVVQIEVQP